MNSTELLNEIKNQLELLKHKGYDKNSFKSGYLLGYAKALQLQQTGVIKSVCNHCNNQLCDSQTFNQQCFKCGKKPQ
jgi:hypothetical protein